MVSLFMWLQPPLHYSCLLNYNSIMPMNIKSIRVGDCYIPDLTLPEEPRPIGRWGRMHRDYLILNPGDENGIELQIR